MNIEETRDDGKVFSSEVGTKLRLDLYSENDQQSFHGLSEVKVTSHEITFSSDIFQGVFNRTGLSGYVVRELTVEDDEDDDDDES